MDVSSLRFSRLYSENLDISVNSNDKQSLQNQLQLKGSDRSWNEVYDPYNGSIVGCF